jgi:hypothetical protein
VAQVLAKLRQVEVKKEQEENSRSCLSQPPSESGAGLVRRGTGPKEDPTLSVSQDAPSPEPSGHTLKLPRRSASQVVIHIRSSDFLHGTVVSAVLSIGRLFDMANAQARSLLTMRYWSRPGPRIPRVRQTARAVAGLRGRNAALVIGVVRLDRPRRARLARCRVRAQH